ncbi:MAG: peptidoglycan-binding protein [Rhodobacteraceae bacterium]|nr:peptidoglycan-binding protein [Paracoccaceae bacterium]
MTASRVVSAALATLLAVPAARPALADADGLVGGIIGGVIGGAIVAESQKNRRHSTTTRAATSGTGAAQREENRQVQTALNYFGYPVGTPDGAIGPKSRAAIADYQLTLGYAPTGQLTEFEKTFLLGSYQRALAGGALTTQQAAANPMGMKGLLVAWRDEAAGQAPQGQTAVAPQAGADPSNPFARPSVDAGATAAAAATGAAPATDPAPGPAPGAAQPALPTFMAKAGGATAGPSPGTFCTKVSLMTATNGYTTLAGMQDPGAALGEQFCLARGYAVTLGEELAGQVAGYTPQEVADQCMGFGPAMAQQIALLGTRPAAEVMAEVATFAAGTGMAPDQLLGTARICLGTGYAREDMNVALASALILTTMGQPAYGEIIGHHLAQGFGVPVRPDLAFDWYMLGVGAASQPGGAVFAPGQPERLEVVRAAATAIAGHGLPAPAAPVPATLPAFKLPGAPQAPAAGDSGSLIEAPAQPEAAGGASKPVMQASAAAAPDVGAAPVVEASAPAGVGAAPAGEVAAADGGGGLTDAQVGALPLVAQLPFLLFRN